MNEFQFKLGMDCKRRCDLVLNDYNHDVITLDQAKQRLCAIEDSMFEEYPDAEPDGEITYTVATAREELPD